MLRRLDFECERVCGDGTSHSPRRARASRAALVAGLVLQSGVLFSTLLFGQGSNTALVRGTVIDSSGAVVPNATVNMTNDGTKVVEKGNSDSAGRFIFNALKPASYTAQVEAQGFKTLIQEHIVLRVGQQIDLTFPLELGAVSQTLKIEAEAPLINTVSGALGTEVTNRYIVDMPLLDRSVINLAYLAPGVTEVAGSGIGSLGGTNFVSNGQRNGTAEFRLDGGLATTPEGGEGGNTFLSYLPSVEAIQEFKIQNNSFSAEYGNNGGTVVSIVTKSGTNSFHGSGWYFLRRPSLDANDFFANRDCPPPGDASRPADGCKGAYAHDQYGASLGGPIYKQKTFFFADYERSRNNSPFTMTTSVPTALQRQGDFSQTFNSDGSLQQIFNPRSVIPITDSSGAVTDYQRAPFPGNLIPANMMDSIGQKVISLYPLPTGAGDSGTGLNNYTAKLVETNPNYQLDTKIDQYFTERSRLSGRFSLGRGNDFRPDPFLAPNTNLFNSTQGTIEHIWTPTPTLLWTNRIGLTRYLNRQDVKQTVDPVSVGFPESLVSNPWYQQKNFPNIDIDNYQSLVSDACCTNTVEADTQWLLSSMLTKTAGSHNLKFGVEHRIALNNFFQPSNTSGGFGFGAGQTAQSVYDPNTDAEGNGLASLVLGWASSGGLGLLPAVANKSSETSFFVQDDWKVSRRLTINFGLRYEWSVPYSERYNRDQYTCFTCDSGVKVPALGDFPGKELFGTSIFASSKRRHADIDWNNVAPRLGFAYALDTKTVLRGGGGVYYGLNYLTNWQYGGAAWNRNVNFNVSKDGGVTQYGTMENPLPDGFVYPQERQYGEKTLWGFANGNHDGLTNRNAEIYQWNIGIQRELPGSILLEVNYSASRSVHLPFRSLRRQNNIDSATRELYGTAGLAKRVPNPFQYMFTGPDAIFNEPTSLYNASTITRVQSLRPYPQFAGALYGLAPFSSNARYNALQVRLEKRLSHGLSIVGSYTFSRMLSDSDEGANPWIGSLSDGEPQDKTNLQLEKSVSANDTPQRLAFAVVYELPVGRGKAFGNSMGRVMDALVGGWKINSFVTFQTGQPLAVWENRNRLTDGRQRPNLSGHACSSLSAHEVVDGAGNYFNVDSFSHPADQFPGSSPRYIEDCRTPGIRNLDVGIGKQFHIREGMFAEVRGEFFNSLNTVRFAAPGKAFGSGAFGIIGSQANSPRHGQFGVRFVF